MFNFLSANEYVLVWKWFLESKAEILDNKQ